MSRIQITRRELLAAGASFLTPGIQEQPRPFGIPGPYPGRVVEVSKARAVENGNVDSGAVRVMLARGVTELTGEREEVLAWRRFVKPGEVVGIKACPVGLPLSISQPETMLEIIRALNQAGIPNKDIIVFNRYESEYREAGIGKLLPAGVREAFGSLQYDDLQTRTEGYDTDVFVEFPRVMTGVDAANPVNRRSHLCVVVSMVVDKVINVCCLKDHASAGITMALKNLSHGLVNNVCRTHPSAELNWCDTFIPSVVAMPRIREKVVLNICDGLIGTYDGGPGKWNPHFRTWEHNALFFSTDPVAMDRIGWQILDRKRAESNLPPLAETGKKLKNPGHESFDERQPQHVLLAGKAGLGEANLQRIEHKKVVL